MKHRPNNSHILLLFCYSLIFFNAGAQIFSKNPFNEKYGYFIKQAEDHYNKKEYRLSAQYYSQAFLSNDDKGKTDDRYNAAASWTLAGEKDSAFSQLFKILNARFAKYNALLINRDFNSLHTDSRWESVTAKAKSNRIQYYPDLNIPLSETLDTMLQSDQKFRTLERGVRETYGQQSKELAEMQKTIEFYDAQNIKRLRNVLREYRWPSADISGPEGSTALFLVIQHSDTSVQDECMPFVREALDRKYIPASWMALLEDRLALAKGEKQVYGSQVGLNKDGKYALEPLEDPDHVDERRAAIGLGPLSDYLQGWGITFPEKQ